MENGGQVRVSRICVGLGKPSYLTAYSHTGGMGEEHRC